MSEAQALFAVLKQSAGADCVAALERLVREAPDRQLSRINVLDLAKREGLDEERTIAAFLHAAQIGLFDMSWNVLCPSCGGVLDANTSLKNVRSDEYHCAFCNIDNEPTLDDMVEVSFTVSLRARRIAAHNPDELTIWEYYRQVFWGTAVDLPEENLEAAMQKITLDAVELPAGEKALLSLQLPVGFVIVLEPATHSAQFVEVKGEPTDERQNLALVYHNVRATTAITELRPGPLRLSLDDRTGTRVLPAVFLVNDAMNALIGKRQPYLSAKRLLSNQTFRDIYRTHTLEIGIHEGPCLAVSLNERQDYFGQTVNIASRVQGLATSRSILATAPVIQNPRSASLLGSNGQKPVAQSHALRGIASEVP